MEPLCDVCKVDRAVVYCKSDVAKLCLHCDRNVHSSNFLFRKHTRSLICGKCSSEPAIIRYANSAVCLCEGCDSSSENGRHDQHQKLDCYSGCPSPAELMTKILSEGFDDDSMANNDSSFQTPGSVVASKLNELASCLKFEQWAISIPSNPTYLTSYNIDQKTFFSKGSSFSKQSCTSVKDLEVHGGEDLAKGVDLDELSSDSSYKIFISLQQSHHSEDRELDCLVLEKKLSATGSNIDVEIALEATSGQHEFTGFQSSQEAADGSASANFMLMNPSCNKNIALSSPFLSTDESSRDWKSEASLQQARNEAKMRYNEKKKSRT